MTIGELQSFLEGMDVKDAPTPEQWKRIKGKIDSLRLEEEGRRALGALEYPKVFRDFYYGDPPGSIPAYTWPNYTTCEAANV